jgi:hypothetical protein
MSGIRKLLWCSLDIEKDTSFTVHGFGIVVLLIMISRWYNVYLHVEDIRVIRKGTCSFALPVNMEGYRN